ncbi:MAG: lipoate-protein ligase [Cyanobacteria bacterium RYN_339]|nr:lipoate-protein ligase [Cyanobacteria bacterium RYN_339]
MEVRWLGRKPYAEVWALQKQLVEAIAAGDTPDTLLLVEHDPIFTLGRKAGAAGNVLDAGDIPVLQVERGGDVTYHGPGQLVGYPLVALRDGERDLHRYLRNLEAWLIAVLADYGLEAERNEGLTGVWARGKKLASLGVAVRKWVTYHGFALNVDPDLSHFARLNPCGLQSSVMASLASELGRAPAMDEVVERVLAHAPMALGRQAVCV